MKIGTIGAKQIGKNFIHEICFSDCKQYALADILKEVSFNPEYHGIMNHNSNYFENDFKTVLMNKELQNRVLIEAKKDGLVVNLDKTSFSVQEKIDAVNVFKKFSSELTTRKILQNFGDVLKKQESFDFLSRTFLEKVDGVDNVFNTDTRFFTEVFDFILNDYFILTLFNSDIEEKYIGSEYLQHTSEFELSIGIKEFGHIGYLWDVTGEGDKINNQIRRKNINTIIAESKDLRKKIDNFKGYSNDVKKQIQIFKDEMSNPGNEGFSLVKQYENIYAMEWSKKMNNQEYDEELMLEAYKIILSRRKIIQDLIKNIYN